jgi:dynein regulatry complex protein 1
LRLKTQ